GTLPLKQNHPAFGFPHNFSQQPRQLQSALAFGQAQHSPRQLKINVDQRGRKGGGYVLQRGRLPTSGRTHHQNQTVVQIASPVDLAPDLIRQRLRHWSAPPSSFRTAKLSARGSTAAFFKHRR